MLTVKKTKKTVLTEKDDRIQRVDETVASQTDRKDKRKCTGWMKETKGFFPKEGRNLSSKGTLCGMLAATCKAKETATRIWEDARKPKEQKD